MCFRDSRIDAFAEDRKKFLEVIAGQIALSLERVMRQKQLEEKESEIEKLREDKERITVPAVTDERLGEIAGLAGAVNREIADPLSTIVGNARIIELEGGSLGEKVREQLQAIHECARKISLATHKLARIDDLVRGTNLDKERSGETKHAKVTGDKLC